MASHTIPPSPSVFPPKPHGGASMPLSLRPWWTSTTRAASTTLQCHKMYVPGFGEASPEAKAAKHLHDFFTYVAVRIVIAQLESYNEEAYADMMKFMKNHSVDDGDKFCADLMRESSNHKALRTFYPSLINYFADIRGDFEWDNLHRLSQKMVEDRNTKVMRDYLSETTMKSEN
ncbi:chaperonin-like RBCX protein 1, chloroplastic isoform X2 [Salvia splendens]|uniref:chaperonin-like RBCX protein 1, chloroplastic isoform X2 n=1 Tax=Salvia splendens TaxID=180675 RepID=UPI001C255629|nr:chaperonin-like RBCX protein 1, chloroplastic isoform X2 [Salvia splendens]